MARNSRSSQSADRFERLKVWAGPLLLAVAFIAGLAWSWGMWPDLQIDFGRELYVPWRIGEGDVLYRDIAWFHGPFSPYLNACWFQLLGVSLRTLVIANSLIAAGVLAMIYWLVRSLADRQAALLAGLTFLGALAFSQYIWAGNFNWICPYSHEVTHGTALALASLILLHWNRGTSHLARAAAAGVCLGLVFLTKCEIFFAALAANLACWGAIVLHKEQRQRATAYALLAWVAGGSLTVFATFGLLASQLPARQALFGVLGGWVYVVDPKLTSNPYYKIVLGTDKLWDNISQTLLWLLGYALFLGLLLIVARKAQRSQHTRLIAAVVLAVAALTVVASPVIWANLALPWPLLVAVMIAVSARKLWRQTSANNVDRLALWFCLAVFSLALMSRMLLNARLYHYGFAMTLPAAALLAAAVWTWLPQWAKVPPGGLMIYRAGVLGAWLAILVMLIQLSDRRFRGKGLQVGAGDDLFQADGRASSIAPVVSGLQQMASPQDTLVVLPEGVMLNYLTRRVNPTPFTNFIPPELVMHGEERMLKALEDSPPDWIILLTRDTDEYGARTFTRDYAQRIGDWVEQNYALVGVVGDHPLQSDADGRDPFGAALGRRKHTNQTTEGSPQSR